MRFVSTAFVMMAMALMLLALTLTSGTLMLVGRWSAFAGGHSVTELLSKLAAV